MVKKLYIFRPVPTAFKSQLLYSLITLSPSCGDYVLEMKRDEVLRHPVRGLTISEKKEYNGEGGDAPALFNIQRSIDEEWHVCKPWCTVIQFRRTYLSEFE